MYEPQLKLQIQHHCCHTQPAHLFSKIAVLGESSRFQPSELSGNCGAILFSVVWTSLEYSATTCGGSLLPVIADSSICNLSTGYLQASGCKVDAGNVNCDSCFP